MTENRWIKFLFIVIVTFFLLDELAYYWWKDMNPGASWALHWGKTAPPQTWPNVNTYQ